MVDESLSKHISLPKGIQKSHIYILKMKETTRPSTKREWDVKQRIAHGIRVRWNPHKHEGMWRRRFIFFLYYYFYFFGFFYLYNFNGFFFYYLNKIFILKKNLRDGLRNMDPPHSTGVPLQLPTNEVMWCSWD